MPLNTVARDIFIQGTAITLVPPHFILPPNTTRTYPLNPPPLPAHFLHRKKAAPNCYGKAAVPAKRVVRLDEAAGLEERKTSTRIHSRPPKGKNAGTAAAAASSPYNQRTYAAKKIAPRKGRPMAVTIIGGGGTPDVDDHEATVAAEANDDAGDANDDDDKDDGSSNAESGSSNGSGSSDSGSDGDDED